MLRLLLVSLAVLAVLLGVAASPYGSGLFGQAAYGPLGPTHYTSHSDSRRADEPAPPAVVAPEVPSRPHEERPAAVLVPEHHASIADGLRSEIIRERASLRSEGFSTEPIDTFVEISSATSDLDTLRTHLATVRSYGDDARFSRATLVAMEANLDDAIRQDRNGLTGHLLAEVDDSYSSTSQITQSIRSAVATGDYALAASLIRNARLSFLVEQNRPTLSRLLSTDSLVMFLTFFLLISAVAIGGRRNARRAMQLNDDDRRRLQDLSITILVGVVLIGALAAAFGAVWGATMIRQEQEAVEAKMDLIEARVSLYLRGVETTGNILGRVVQEEIDQTGVLTDPGAREGFEEEFLEDTTEHVLQIAQSGETIMSVYTSLNPEVFGKVYGIWFVEEDGVWSSLPDDEAEDPLYLTSQDPRQDDPAYAWYFDAVREGKPVWTQVYTDEDLNITMISYVGPMYENGTLLGTWGVDVQFDGVYEAVQSVDLGYEGFVFLVDREFVVLGEPPQPVPWLPEVKDRLRSEHGTFFHDTHVISYHRLPNGYRVILVIPRDEFEGITTTLNQHYVLYTIFFAVLLMALIVILLRLSSDNDGAQVPDADRGFMGELRRLRFAFRSLWAKK